MQDLKHCFISIADPGYSEEGVRLLGDLKDNMKKSLAHISERDEEAIDTYARLHFDFKTVERDERLRRYPSLPPNHACRHALIEGITFDNIPVTSNLGNAIVEDYQLGNLIPLMRFGCEDVFVWDCMPPRDGEGSQFGESRIVVQVDEKVHQRPLWITLGSALMMARTVKSDYESISEGFSYNWIYYFNPNIALSDQEHTIADFHSSTEILSYRDFFEMLDVLELLQRDERYFTATQHLISSYQNHWFCTVCALTPEHQRSHDYAEPECWKRVTLIGAMDVARVQATRTAEALLGEPNKMDNFVGLHKMKQKWKHVSDLDPDATFDQGGMSLFGILRPPL